MGIKIDPDGKIFNEIFFLDFVKVIIAKDGYVILELIHPMVREKYDYNRF